MNFNQFNFSDPEFLWFLLAIPALALMAFVVSRRGQKATTHLEKFADRHLLPHLLVQNHQSESRIKRSLGVWSLIIALGALALSGPRWDFHDVHTFRPSRSLVLLLDLSNTMDATDVKPSRLALARQKIEDILNASPGVSVGLVAFAGDSHMITPITEDKSAILHLLSSIKTDLVVVQGSRLEPALKMAGEMLAQQPGNQKSILLLSDGGFEDTSRAIAYAKDLSRQSVHVNAMGFGTQEGAPIPGGVNGFVRDSSGNVVMSRLQLDVLAEITQAGNGTKFRAIDSAFQASQPMPPAREFFSTSLSAAPQTQSAQTIRDWEPRFYLLLIPMMLLLLPFYRATERSKAKNCEAASRMLGRLAVLLCFGLLFTQANLARAATSAAPDSTDIGPRNAVADSVTNSGANSGSEKISSSALARLFKNKNIQGQEAYAAKNYSKAVTDFSDPYRRGVAQFREGKFQDAEKSFRANKRGEVATDAKYDLGNALAAEGKYPEAIQAYKDVLKTTPKHADAAANLKILQDMMKNSPPPKQAGQKPQDQKNSGESKQDQQNQAGQDQSQKKDQDQNGKKDPKAGEKSGQKQASHDGKNKDGKGKKGDEKQAAQASSGNPGKNQDEKQNQQATANKQGPEQGKTSLDKNKVATPGDKQLEDADENAPVEPKHERTARDVDADQWLNQISNDPHSFLKNQFSIESARAKTQQGEHE